MEENQKSFETFKKSREYKKIKKDLTHQLKVNGANTPTFLSQVDDYMSMWVIKEMLIADIEKRGANISYDNGGGQKGTKKNDSIAEQVKVNSQMLKILDTLKIKPSALIDDYSDL